MATAPTRTDRLPIDPSVVHPLDRLRGIIRRYVVIEGLLTVAIFLAAWFAIGLALDFGVFKLFTWDWVLDGAWSLRLVVLVLTLVALATIVTLRIVRRLTTELSYPSLALVLERRFPRVLGDRLITAVELADVEQSASYGYSADLVRQTIAEAREKVGTVPVEDVFNWRRLKVMGMVAGGLALFVVLFGLVSYVAATGSANVYRYGWRFAHVTGTFLERNVLLTNTPWPRRAHMEVVRFPGDELRIGRDAAAPVIRAKAFQWVVADPGVRMGWRPMTWGDLNESLVGGSVPQLPADAMRAAAETPDLPAGANDWPIDVVRTIAIDDQTTRTKLNNTLPGDEYAGLQNGLERVFTRLDALAAQPSMGRRLRKLDIPEKVALVYSGQSKTGDVTLTPQQNNEFAGAVSELKESVEFVIRAEDYRTPPRTITLVPPPLFTKLARTEYQPAYLHHAPPQDGSYPDLRGLRQLMAEKPLSLTGDRSIFAVPSGTELVLTATADVDLTAAFIQPKVGILPLAKPGSADVLPLTIADDRRTVRVEFLGEYRLAAGRTIEHYYVAEDGWLTMQEVPTTPVVEFDVIVEQADGVQSRRQLLIQIAEDQPPVVEVAPDVIRKVGNNYMVTPNARIPFNPESLVRDDHGLSKVAYDFTYWAEDTDIGRALRGQLVARAFLYPPGPVTLPGVVAPPFHAAKFNDLDKGDNRKNGSAELSRFTEQRRGLLADTRDRLTALLREPLSEGRPPLVTRVEMKSYDVDYFDVQALKLAATGDEIQTRYRLDLNVLATDTNYDTGPRTGQNQDVIKLLIVHEGDLLAEINKEEEGFGVRLDEAIAKVAGAKKKYDFLRAKNGTGGPEDLDTARVRSTDALQDVNKARDVVASVVREYRRIYRECQFNRVTPVTTVKFGQFGNRIDRVLGENPPRVTEDDVVVPPQTTFPVVEKRMEAVMAPLHLTPAAWVPPVVLSDAGMALDQLERELKAIRAALGERESLEKWKKALADVIARQKEITKAITDWESELADRLKLPQVLGVGPQFMAKGDAKKLKHGINWKLYPKDELAVTLKVYAAADKERKTPLGADVLTHPPQLKLTFDNNPMDFEYDLKAGNKEGEYVLVLTPEAGGPVVVPVTVK